jgi:hypothetical protein
MKPRFSILAPCESASGDASHSQMRIRLVCWTNPERGFLLRWRVEPTEMGLTWFEIAVLLTMAVVIFRLKPFRWQQ